MHSEHKVIGIGETNRTWFLHWIALAATNFFTKLGQMLCDLILTHLLEQLIFAWDLPVWGVLNQAL